MNNESVTHDPPNAELARHLTLAIKASQELLLLAQAERWQDFERQFRQRDTLLHRIDDEVTHELPLSQEQGALVATKLQQLRELNDQLLQTAAASKNALFNELSKDRKARQALDAYKKS